MKVLLIKTTSLGDIIHMLPAVTDATKKIKNIQFDWVVEEVFQEIPRWHPAVNRVIPVAYRRWKKTPIRSFLRREFWKFLKNLRQEHYDYVIDTQGLIKSAVLTFLSRGKRVGLNTKSLTEKPARLAYQKTVEVNLQDQAVFRMRNLLAQALDYDIEQTPADYGVFAKQFNYELGSEDYILFLHGTTWQDKHWADKHWITLANLIAQEGYQILLPWSTPTERARAEKIMRYCHASHILPKLSLTEMAGIIAHSKGVITVDTGLGHLAAGLDIPTVSLYGPTHPNRTGMVGNRLVTLLSNFECINCRKKDCRHKKFDGIDAVCLLTISPENVWEQMKKLIKVNVIA